VWASKYGYLLVMAYLIENGANKNIYLIKIYQLIKLLYYCAAIGIATRDSYIGIFIGPHERLSQADSLIACRIYCITINLVV
jgi:hypothetical protein